MSRSGPPSVPLVGDLVEPLLIRTCRHRFSKAFSPSSSTRTRRNAWAVRAPSSASFIAVVDDEERKKTDLLQPHQTHQIFFFSRSSPQAPQTTPSNHPQPSHPPNPKDGVVDRQRDDEELQSEEKKQNLLQPHTHRKLTHPSSSMFVQRTRARAGVRAVPVAARAAAFRRGPAPARADVGVSWRRRRPPPAPGSG